MRSALGRPQLPELDIYRAPSPIGIYHRTETAARQAPYKTFGAATARGSLLAHPTFFLLSGRSHPSMGNCQAAEAAAVLIQHPGEGRTERAYLALSAGAVMAANPGHYVAAVIATTPPPATGDAAAAASASAPVKHLKLLRPDDTLLLGRVYRLVSFEGTHARAPEVLREFSSKRHVKLSRVTIKAKDEDEEPKPAAKHRRRRRARGDISGGAANRKDSDRSLAKSQTHHSLHRPTTSRLMPPRIHSPFPSIQVMRQTEDVEPEPEPSPSGPGMEHGQTDDAATADLDAELEAMLPHAALTMEARASEHCRRVTNKKACHDSSRLGGSSRAQCRYLRG
ncbi:hypothetical protein HU200_025505 [Digitaria exilis]|uniref:Uncharacterized protein n=1 Tax=Digitaria exilis TaxID=1010633 RepID=A0A835BWN5_9POAL|nr:hypothetical protein HU200_025505 [Digitaria exilis]